MNTSYTSSSAGGSFTDAVVDTMVRWPMRMTGATVDAMIRGVQSVTGGRPSSGTSTNGSSATWESQSSTAASSAPAKTNAGWTSLFSSQTSGTFDQDLGGDDLKYVIWSIVFTKPGYECILQKQQEELVNYAADSSTYAAVKIAKFLDSARYGHCERPAAWSERGYPNDGAKNKSTRKESASAIATPGSTTVATSGTGSASEHGSAGERSDKGEKGWRIPAEDQKYISFLYHVDRRMPKQQEEVTRTERVTVERGTRVV